ncbi:hypothetical protein Sste5346_006392 [Sporothrix stenoceras]|uniref:Uncharacterized protein n=1 Tax=Sporothrix stenoceras TaxID=5173 RepID=A0ABR3Z053_9PEZI
MAANDFLWRQTTPGVWERNIDEAEEFYYTVAQLYQGSGRMFFAITGHASLRVAIPTGVSPAAAERRLDAALRHAWLALRFDHPTIASQVVHQKGAARPTKIYRCCADSAGATAWLNKTLVPVSTGQTGVEWANADPPAPVLPTLFVVHVPDDAAGLVRRDLVLRSPHDIIDGMGTLLLLNNYIAHVSKFYSVTDSLGIPHLDGSELKNLSPPYREAASVPDTLSASQLQRAAEMAAQKAAAAGDEQSTLTIPFVHGPVLPGKHQRVALALPAAQTAQIVQLCKTLGATVTHVFHAAIALAMRDIEQTQTQAGTVRYVGYLLRNDRPYCNAPYNTARHPAALYHSASGQALVVNMTLQGSNEKRAEFLDVVRGVQSFYEEVRNDAEHGALASLFWKTATPSLPASSTVPPVPPPKTSPSVSLSSMGKMDTVISPSQGAVQVYDPWVTGEELGNGLGAFLGTYRGELCFSAAYNDAWHTAPEVMGFLERCRDMILANVEVPMQD